MDILEKIDLMLGEAKKTKETSMVLQLMDNDHSYQDALKIVIKKTGIDKTKLEKDLDNWI